MGRVQVVIGWKVHATPLGVLGWMELLELIKGDNRGLSAIYI
jgi:hypothetical protein